MGQVCLRPDALIVEDPGLVRGECFLSDSRAVDLVAENSLPITGAPIVMICQCFGPSSERVSGY